MKTILLGPNGQLGTDIQVANLRRGGLLKIIPLDRSMVDFTDCDGASQYLMSRQFDCLINCASYHKTDEVEKNAQLAFTINAHFVQKLAAICFAKNALLVHISTDYVFGGKRGGAPFTEYDCKNPVNIYGASKALGEQLALLSGANVLVLRVASLFGVAGASREGRQLCRNNDSHGSGEGSTASGCRPNDVPDRDG